MTEVDSRVDIGQTVEKDIAGHHILADPNMDKIIEEDTEETLGKVVEILTGIEVDQETDNFHKTTEEMAEVAVGQAQV